MSSAAYADIPQMAKRTGCLRPVFESAPEFAVKLPKCINQAVYAAAENDMMQIIAFFIFVAFIKVL